MTKARQKKPIGRPRKGPPLLTRQLLAKALQCNSRTIQKWQDEGLPVAQRGRGGRPNKYDELKVRAWLAARNDAQRQGEPVSFMKERARKERAQAVLAEQLFQMRAGTLLKIDDVDRLIQAEQTAVRSKLVALALTHADRVHRSAVLDGVAGVERTLREIAHDVLRELADPSRLIAMQEPDDGEEEPGGEDSSALEEETAR